MLVATSCALAACSSSDDDDGNNANDSNGENTGTETGGGENTGTEGGSSSATATTVDGITSIRIDATAGGFGADDNDPANHWTYYDISNATVLDLSDEAAASSNEWDIAFKRNNVILNGGVSGNGQVKGGIVDAQLDFYNEENEPLKDVFMAATAENELAALTEATDMSAVEFLSDHYVANIVGTGQTGDNSWFLYDPSTHQLSANADAWFAVRGASGDSYAKLHVTDIQTNERQVTTELFIQGAGASNFDTNTTTWVASPGAEGGKVCYDFETMGEMDCDSAADSWDLQLDISADGRSWNLWTNGGVYGSGDSGGSFGPMDAALATDTVNGASVPNWFDDTTGGVFADYPWYVYNLNGSHRLWPNFRVYAIETPEGTYKLQLVGYYDEGATSGFVSIRHMPVAAQ
ncbi:MAG: hypothetical protein CSB44_00195 [Gammaproteobacteria bacterium]|nr:MAG: hypothetical protein CSB44_00195 [Gammaproteobacteria bacterium]